MHTHTEMNKLLYNCSEMLEHDFVSPTRFSSKKPKKHPNKTKQNHNKTPQKN